MTKIVNAENKKKLKIEEFNARMPWPRETPSLPSAALENTSESLCAVKNLFASNDLQVSTDHLLHRVANGTNICSTRITLSNSNPEILATYILCLFESRDGNNESNPKLIASLKTMMKKIQKLDKNFKYEKELDTLISSESSTSNRRNDKYLKHKNQLSTHLLTRYFRRIMNRVVPPGCFGSHRNRNIVIQSITHLLKAPRFQVVNLKTYLFKLEISKISWLNVVENINEQWYALAKWLLWLFNDFVIEIMQTQLFTVVSNSYRKLYFKQSDWMTLVRTYLRCRIADGSISRICYDLEKMNGLAWHWTLVPKKNTVRPVISLHQCAINESEEIQKRAQIYLQQLSVMNYGTKTLREFHKTWKKVVKKFQRKNKKMYLVSCDIKDAYGSINQAKLLEIVEHLTQNIGSVLQLKCYKISRQAGSVEHYEISTKWFYANSELQLPLAKNTLVAEMSAKTVEVQKEMLTEAIRKCVREQIVSVSQKSFLLNKGIGQGALLSPDLCNIYYGHMAVKYFAEYENNGFLFRYVDDILFITEDEELAKRFLQQVKTGIPEYNCTFNAAKTCANFGEHKHTGDFIPFLGYNIHIASRQIIMNYSESAQYTMMSRQPEENKIIKTIRDRLMNFAALKLNGITLDYKINNELFLLANIQLGFIRQAERCLCLVRNMFEDVSGHVKQIFNVMQVTNLQLCQYIGSCLKSNGLKNCRGICLEMRWVIWQCYMKVFRKAPNIYSHFRAVMLKARRFKSQKPIKFLLVDFIN